MAFGTGLRPSEQYALQWEHVDFQRKLLLIRQGFVKDRMMILKTTGSRRDVEILPHVEDALRTHFKAAHGEFVFSNEVGGPLHRDNVRNRTRMSAVRLSFTSAYFVASFSPATDSSCVRK